MESMELFSLASFHHLGTMLSLDHPLILRVLSRNDSAEVHRGGGELPIVTHLLPPLSSRHWDEFENDVADPTFRVVDQIGSGSFGEVFLAQSLECPTRFYALKRVPLAPSRPNFLSESASLCNSFSAIGAERNWPSRLTIDSNFMKELRVLEQVGMHPNTSPHLGVYMSPSSIYFVMRLATLGTLEDLFYNCQQQEKAPRSPFHNEQFLRELVKQCVDGLRHLHSRGIVHRDVKPANILVRGSSAHNAEFSFADYGISSLGRTPPSDDDGSTTVNLNLTNRTVIGTQAFAAPEILSSWGVSTTAVYGTPCDVWSLGAILYSITALGDVDGICRCPTDVYRICCGSLPRLMDLKRYCATHSEQLNALLLNTLHDATTTCGDNQSTTAGTTVTGGVNDKLEVIKMQSSLRLQKYSDEFLSLIDGMMTFDPKRRMSLGNVSEWLSQRHQPSMAQGAKYFTAAGVVTVTSG